MKNNNYNGKIVYVCIVAILCYSFVNGQQVALEMQEKEQPEFASRVVGSIGRLPGGVFLSRQLAATVAHIANYDISMAEGVVVQAEAEPETTNAQAGNMPEQNPAAQENAASDPADSPAPSVVAETPDAQPGIAASTATQTPQGSQQPTVESPTSALDAQADAPQKSSVEATVSVSSLKGEAENKGNKKRAKAAGKSIFANPLSHRYKALLVGDSFMEDITLAIMRNYYNNDPNIQFISVAKHSTGLCVSTNWNWPKKLEEFMQKHKPDVVLFFIGANDLQNIFDGQRRYSFTSAEWKKKYVEIAESMIDIARKGNAVPIWIGLPVMSEAYAKWIPLVSELQHKACANRKIEYVDTVPTLADENGQYQVFMKTPTGEMVRIRKADRYHVDYAGSLMIIEQVVPSIKKCILEKEKVYGFALPAGSPQASR